MGCERIKVSVIVQEIVFVSYAAGRDDRVDRLADSDPAFAQSSKILGGLDGYGFSAKFDDGQFGEEFASFPKGPFVGEALQHLRED